ncbi:RulB protein [Pseudomonas syringae pv. solidagae]|uniref:RulB protein n=1 Tax=Pseudomonas syringae pv. solidagae TaxID=264458 RepID=A0A0Q0AEM7_PSESX|nr:RulB protein [Pseudomonas syringae pv. solidagae]RMT40472.1 RulB protein [Pseudomonas syringae pv. solidagae]
MFGKRLTELDPIKEAVATYMMRASEKLRAQGSVCKKILVSIRTGMGHAADLRNAQFKACLVGEPAEFGKNRTLSTADRRHALVQPGLCPIEVHLKPASGCSLAPRQTRAVFCIF